MERQIFHFSIQCSRDVTNTPCLLSQEVGGGKKRRKAKKGIGRARTQQNLDHVKLFRNIPELGTPPTAWRAQILGRLLYTKLCVAAFHLGDLLYSQPAPENARRE